MQEANYRRSCGGDSRGKFHASKGEAIPGLSAYNKGREVWLAFAEDVGRIISDAFSNDNDANEMCLQRAARIVRQEMFTESPSQNCQGGSIPQTLL